MSSRLVIRGARAAAGLSVALALAVLLLVCVAPAARAAAWGIVDERLETSAGVDRDALPGILAGLGPGGLHAQWSRVIVSWARLQPSATLSASQDANGDGYADAYVSELDAVVDGLRGQGITVMLTGSEVPRWASDSRFWPASGYDPGVAMRVDDGTVRQEYLAFSTFLARHFAGRVRYFECWNEPNLSRGIYPQWLGGKPVGPADYLKMLKIFHQGVRAGASGDVVIAGATAPRGTNNSTSTAPQWFARYLKAAKATKWFDAYSHHPYTPGGSRHPAPDRLPNNPSRCVTLANLGALMSVFPSKPFYLTEFGYNTHASDLFGLEVSQADQARYLRQAFRMMASRPRVKVLMWYDVVDWCFDPADPPNGVYCGLIEKDGVTRKPAWYAFARRNRLTLDAPSSVAAGTPLSIAGVLTTALGPLEGQTLRLEARAVSAAPWTRLAATRTSAAGAYAFSARQAKDMQYRVVWDGVCESAARTVKTP
jgi:hypothetical protein